MLLGVFVMVRLIKLCPAVAGFLGMSTKKKRRNPKKKI